MTAVGIVLPEEIYNAVDHTTAWRMLGKGTNLMNDDGTAFYFVKDGTVVKRYNSDEPEWRLISMLKACSLAR